MRARIYRPTKTAMKSGRSKAKNWVLENEPACARRPEPLMGWVAAAHTSQQIRLTFERDAEVFAYAERKGIDYLALKSRESKIQRKSYADNFAVNRRMGWTH